VILDVSGVSGKVLRLEDLPVILVIEDDQEVQSIIEDALSEGGFEPAVAAWRRGRDPAERADLQLPRTGDRH